MDEQQHNQSGLQKFNFILVLILLVSFIGGFSFMMMKMNNFIDEQAEVEALYIEINDLEADITDRFKEMNDKLKINESEDKFKNTPLTYTGETKVVTYINEDKGISFSFSYKEVYDEYGELATPYLEKGSSVGIIPQASPSFPWEINLQFKDLTDLPKEELGVKVLGEVEINGLKVIKTEESGLCYYPTMTVVGDKYLYEFSPSCSTVEDLEADFLMLEDIIKTIKLN